MRSGALLAAGVLAGVLITHGLNSAAFLRLRSDEAAASAAIQMANLSQVGLGSAGAQAEATAEAPMTEPKPTALPQGEPNRSVRLRVTANGLTLRQAPRTDGARISSLPIGTLLIADAGLDESEWVAVSANGTAGWVSRQWVQPEREHATVPPRQHPPAKTTSPLQTSTRAVRAPAAIRDPLPPPMATARPPEAVVQAQMQAAVPPSPSPSQVNTTFEQAGIAGMDSSGIHFRSGRRVAIGEPFPSGEKLLSIDPRNARIVTDRRVINIKVQLPSASPTSP